MHRIQDSRLTGKRTHCLRRSVGTGASAALGLILCFSLTLAGAQKQKKEKTVNLPTPKEVPAPDIEATSIPAQLPDGQAIELSIAQMLGAWQVGDEQAMHAFYSDDVLVVSGAWEPPIQGWKNYLRAYQAQRARTQHVRLDRTNTFTKVFGSTAWSTYQWQFTGEVDGTQTEAVGQTTLMLEKRAGKWLIVLNHTSVVPTPQRAAPTSGAPNSQSLQPTSGPRG
jgi:ketosteroid isomerase-like protein